MRSLSGAGKGSSIEKRERELGSDLEGLEGEGILIRPWRLTEKSALRSLLSVESVCSDPTDSSPLTCIVSEAGARLHIFH